jgi:hypothetical protein
MVTEVDRGVCVLDFVRCSVGYQICSGHFCYAPQSIRCSFESFCRMKIAGQDRDQDLDTSSTPNQEAWIRKSSALLSKGEIIS